MDKYLACYEGHRHCDQFSLPPVLFGVRLCCPAMSLLTISFQVFRVCPFIPFLLAILLLFVHRSFQVLYMQPQNNRKWLSLISLIGMDFVWLPILLVSLVNFLLYTHSQFFPWYPTHRLCIEILTRCFFFSSCYFFIGQYSVPYNIQHTGCNGICIIIPLSLSLLECLGVLHSSSLFWRKMVLWKFRIIRPLVWSEAPMRN